MRLGEGGLGLGPEGGGAAVSGPPQSLWGISASLPVFFKLCSVAVHIHPKLNHTPATPVPSEGQSRKQKDQLEGPL